MEALMLLHRMVRNDFDKLFRDRQSVFGGMTLNRFTSENPSPTMYSDDKHLYIRYALPGYKKSDIKVEIVGNVLNVETKHNEDLLFGASIYSNSIRLPEKLNTNKVKADYRNGILTIKIRKEVEKHVTRTIPVSGTSSPKTDIAIGMWAERFNQTINGLIDSVKQLFKRK